MMTFLTSESMILANAVPMTTPIARSMTRPLKAKALNSSTNVMARLAAGWSLADFSIRSMAVLGSFFHMRPQDLGQHIRLRRVALDVRIFLTLGVIKSERLEVVLV